MDQPAIRPLNVTKTAKHRIVVGLSWDPALPKGILDKLCAITTGKDTHHDLDLSCYIFGADQKFLNLVSANKVLSSAADGHIYHSGDNIEGAGDGDDEEISVELKGLSLEIQNLIFTASISSGHYFEEINVPEIHLYDAYTQHEFLKFDISSVDIKHSDFLAFMRLERINEEDWMLHRLCSFSKAPEENGILDHIKQYLS